MPAARLYLRCSNARRLAGALLLVAAALLPGVGHAQYPDKPIRLVVPFPAGGGADNLARIIMPRVAQALGKPIVIDNRPGAGGNVGAEIVARAAPDGYTLLYGTNGTHSINQALYGNLPLRPGEGLRAGVADDAHRGDAVRPSGGAGARRCRN